MQMYRVRFARKASVDIVDMGDIIVCAASNEAALDMVCAILGLRASEVVFDIARVKPSFWQISRRDVKNSITATEALIVGAANLSNATFPGVTEGRSDEHWYSVCAQASIKAEDENEAIFKLSVGIQREMSGEKQKASTKDLDIKCDRREFHPRTPAVEQNSIFTVRRIFRGGDTRTG